MNLQNLLSKLITFQTVTGNNREIEQLFKWVLQQTEHIPLVVKRIEHKGFPSLLLTTKKTKRPKLWLAAHVDVVPGSPKCFRPFTKSGKLYGRGSLDMKFAIACYLRMLNEISENISRYDFGIMLTSDEEVGGVNGTGALVKKGFTGSFVFLPDGAYNWGIEKKVKGVIHLKIESKGASAHGSRPWEGDDAFWKLHGFLNDLKQYFRFEPCGDQTHYHNTITVGKIEGGKATNQIPGSVTAFVDIRHIPETKRSTLKRALQALQKKHQAVVFRELVSGDSYEMKKEPKEIQTFKRILKDMYGITAHDGFSHGASDARFFRAHNVPVLVTCPLGGNIHTESEWISLRSLEQFYRVLKAWVTNVSS